VARVPIGKAQTVENWEQLPDEEILRFRIKDFKLQIAGSVLESFVERLYEELANKGMRFRPPCYLADEWLCPDRVPIIGIPFWLAHPRLKAIEQKMMFEVEGGTEDSCMKLLRHECGHAVNYAYELYRRTRWRELFGPFTSNYSNSYYYQPYSKRYVIHLEDGYAQAHPDEDFAETFAVWLAPDSRWEDKYGDWPVIRKLRYVDRLIKKIAEKPPVHSVRQRPPWAASRMVSTLAAYYERRRKVLGSSFLGYYDESLKTVFSSARTAPASARASSLLRRNRRRIVDNVARWTGHRKYDVYQLVNKLIARCDALKLYAADGDLNDIVGITAFVTAIASNALRAERGSKR